MKHRTSLFLHILKKPVIVSTPYVKGIFLVGTMLVLWCAVNNAVAYIFLSIFLVVYFSVPLLI